MVEAVSKMISVVQRGWLFEIELTLPGRPTPYPLRQMFASQEDAIAWVKGYEGRREIARIALIYRSQPLPVFAPQSSSTFDLNVQTLRKVRR